jgi:hypothetical protein
MARPDRVHALVILHKPTISEDPALGKAELVKTSCQHFLILNV